MYDSKIFLPVCISFNFLSADNFVLCACVISLSRASVDTVFYSSDLDLSLVVSISVSLNQFTNRQKSYTAALVILLFWKIDHKYI